MEREKSEPAAAGEIEHGPVPVRAGDLEHRPPVQLQDLGQVAEVHVRAAVLDDRRLDARQPAGRDHAQGLVLDGLADGEQLGRGRQGSRRVLGQVLQDDLLERVAGFALGVQERAHGQGGPGRVDLHRADSLALAAGRAVVDERAQLGQQGGRRFAGLDLRVVDALHERAQGDVLVARMEHQAARGLVHGADLLALAAAGAGLDILEQRHERFLVLERGLVQVADEPVEREGERLAGQLAPGQLAGVEHVLRVHQLLVRGQGLDLFLVQERDLGDADAVLARYLAAHLLDLGHDHVRGLVGRGEHGLVVGVDRQVDVAVAVACVHVVWR